MRCRLSLVALLMVLSAGLNASEWTTVSSDTFKLLWKPITYTELQVDSAQSRPANADILDSGYAKRVVIEYKLDVSAERFSDMTQDALADAFDEAELAPYQQDVDRFCSWYLGVDKGDRYSLAWRPKRGLLLSHNDRELGVIENPDAAAMILSVWLGRAAVSESQRDAMLKDWRQAALPAPERLGAAE